jgi:hypothetical protein
MVTAWANYEGPSNPSAAAGSSGVIGARSQLDYYFTIVGPSAGPVPIFLSGTAHLSYIGSGLAAAGLFANNHLNQRVIGTSIECAAPTAYPVAFTECGQQDFLATALFDSFISDGPTTYSGKITMTALVGLTDYIGSTSAQAWIDPLISIDPTFLASNPGYSVVISAGIGNAPAVPEPASWALMIGGFALAGAAIRQRKASIAFG